MSHCVLNDYLPKAYSIKKRLIFMCSKSRYAMGLLKSDTLTTKTLYLRESNVLGEQRNCQSMSLIFDRRNVIMPEDRYNEILLNTLWAFFKITSTKLFTLKYLYDRENLVCWFLCAFFQGISYYSILLYDSLSTKRLKIELFQLGSFIYLQGNSTKLVIWSNRKRI